MKCPYCGSVENKVIDSRPTDEDGAIRRRRECGECKRRFTTYEKVEAISIAVIKKDQSRQPYDRNKILKGIMTACEKRPISIEQMEKAADDVECELYKRAAREISSAEIGDMVLKRLRELDEVAYVRFASVYKRFDSLEVFMRELEEIIGEAYA